VPRTQNYTAGESTLGARFADLYSLLAAPQK
jgi:hypothetical protein